MVNSKKLSPSLKRIIFVLILLIIGAILLKISPFISDLFNTLIDRSSGIISSHNVWGIIIFIFISALSALLSFFSSAILVPFAVVVWGEIPVTLYLLAGWIIGAIFSYYLAYHFGKPLVTKIIKKEKYDRYIQKILDKTTFGLVILFRFAVPSEIGGLVLGLLRYSFVKFLIATVLTELPFAIILAYAGSAFVEQDFTKIIIYIAIIAILLVLFGLLLRKQFNSTSKS